MQDAITEALRRGATAEALDAARAWVAEAPDLADARRWLAVALAQGGEVDAALAEIEQAIVLAPDDAELHLVQGSLLLSRRDAGTAKAALEKATELDPNQLPAYLLQAQVALAAGDLAEARRLAKYAARIDPDHPQLVTLDAAVALRSGKPEQAINLLGNPDLPQDGDPLRYFTLGFAHMQLGHAAFAEAAFRRVLEARPEADGVRVIVSRLCQEQRRTDDALEVLAPLLERPEPGLSLQRVAGLLEMAQGRPARALRWLKPVFEAQPRDRAVREATVQAWLQLDRAAEAGPMLDAAVARHPEDAGLWMALARFTPREHLRALVDRWLAAAPDDLDALEALSMLHDQEPAMADEAIALTRRIAERDPSRMTAVMRLASLEARTDPDAAIARLEDLLSRQTDAGAQSLVRSRMALVHDRAGRFEKAVEIWTARRREAAVNMLPLPVLSEPPAEWPPQVAVDDGTAKVGLLWGGPGSLVELLADQAERGGLPLLADRFGPRPPADPLQRPDTARRLAAGGITPESVLLGWRDALRPRGVEGDALLDWLRWWDNGLLLAMRPHLENALLLFAVRDPRDMLLDWLASGSPLPLKFESPVAAAQWLAGVLDHVATLHEQNLYPHRLIRLDDALADPAALVRALNDALDTQLAPKAPEGPGLERLPAGRWRDYAGVLAEPFGLLHGVAGRLGYASA